MARQRCSVGCSPRRVVSRPCGTSGQPQAGPAGPAGPAGAKGETGAQGQQGAQGAAGKAAEAPIFLFYLSNLPETHPEGAARIANLEEFNKTNELNIRVDLESGGRASTNLDKYKTMAAGGTPPDVAFLSYFDSVNIFASGATADLDQLLKANKDWGPQRADIFPRMLESSMWGGKLAGMPVYTNNAGIIYNKGRLQQAGVPFPQWDGSGQGQYDWNGFKEDLARMQQQDGVEFAFAFRWTRWFWFLGTLGARVITDDGRKITIDRPESVETIDFLQSILKAGYSPPDGAGELYREAKNNIAFEHQGPFRIPTLRQANDAPDFGVLHTPVHPGKREVFAQNGGHNMAVFKGPGTEPEKQEAAAAGVHVDELAGAAGTGVHPRHLDPGEPGRAGVSDAAGLHEDRRADEGVRGDGAVWLAVSRHPLGQPDQSRWARHLADHEGRNRREGVVDRYTGYAASAGGQRLGYARRVAQQRGVGFDQHSGPILFNSPHPSPPPLRRGRAVVLSASRLSGMTEGHRCPLAAT